MQPCRLLPAAARGQKGSPVGAMASVTYWNPGSPPPTQIHEDVAFVVTLKVQASNGPVCLSQRVHECVEVASVCEVVFGVHMTAAAAAAVGVGVAAGVAVGVVVAVAADAAPRPSSNRPAVGSAVQSPCPQAALLAAPWSALLAEASIVGLSLE